MAFVELRSAEEIEGALAALGEAGLDVSRYDASGFAADTMAIVVGVPSLDWSSDGVGVLVVGPCVQHMVGDERDCFMR